MNRNNESFCSLFKEYSFYFGIISLFVFGYLFIQGNCLIMAKDGVDYNLPIYKYEFSLIKELIKGNWLSWYDFRIGYGNNVIGTLNWTGFGDPVSLIFALCNSEASIPYAVSFISFIK